MQEKGLTKEERLRQRISGLELLIADPDERPEVTENRGYHLEFYKKELEDEIRNKQIPSDRRQAFS